MGRLAWSQLRFRTVRLVALLIGMLLATTAFTVLTAASRTSQLETVGTVSANFAPAYDILVRPKGARTRLETETGTVQPDFLSGIYGGITMAQWHQIARIPGVSVAAPIAMVGYALPEVTTMAPVPAVTLARSGRRIYRISTTWVSDNGAVRVAQPPSYLYVTPLRLRSTQNETETDGTGPGCPLSDLSSGQTTPRENPFGIAQSFTMCWSMVNHLDSWNGILPTISRSNPGYQVVWSIPVLVAAIDPAAEAKLDGLNNAVVSGRYLTEHAADARALAGETFPVLASSESGIDEYAQTSLQQLPTPPVMPNMNAFWESAEAGVAGRTVATERTTAQQAYDLLLKSIEPTPASLLKRGVFDGTPITGYWSAGPVNYARTTGGALTARQVANPPRVWWTGYGGAGAISMDEEDSQYRKLTSHTPASSYTNVTPTGASNTPEDAWPVLTGVFDPAKIRSFDPLSQVPLGAYEPMVAAPADAATRKALLGSDLLPSQNLGGLVSQPVNLITTLSALPALEASDAYGGGVQAADPISVIRVRVTAVTGPNNLSLERIKEVAQQIELRTHLDVDIVAGSSPAPTSVNLPAGKFGQPALALTEDWVKKGVAVAIITAVDKNSIALFGLILIVCVLFVANSASAAIRSRRRELGVLACLGWTRPRLFTAVLGELAAIGLTAGLLGAAAALPLSSALGLRASPGRAALAVPVALAVGVLAGLVPAWLAAGAEPVASVRPPVLGVRQARQPRGITGLAAVNVLRTPGRAVVGAVSLALGVAALTVLAAITVAFRGVLVGSLLGNAVAVQVRSVDYIAVAATVTLGVLAVVDVIFLSIQERATELAAIRAFGWREAALSRMVVTEGVIIGLAGSLAGAGAGLAAASQFAGQLPLSLYGVAAAAVATGSVVTAAAALIPAQALRRLPAAHLLAEA
jgi:putative ABC transport system permease protein